jgi:hypothetical protein
MDDLGLWKAQQKVNHAHTEFIEALHRQVRLLTIGLIGTTVAVFGLTLGLILK